MNKLILIITYLICNSLICIAQEDSLSKHGVIKISKPEEKLYIQTFSNFHIYYNDPVNALTYSDFVLENTRNKPVKNSPRFITTEALPNATNDSIFDYTSYFSNHELIKSIRLRKDETDTVRLLIYVDIKGVVKYSDLTVMEKKGNDLWVYDRKKKEYKIDAVHEKTRSAFNELTSNKWVPAKIKTLKKHPSKYKEKYESVDGYMEGVLFIIYSGYPIGH
jgi:hypothetical protein